MIASQGDTILTVYTMPRKDVTKLVKGIVLSSRKMITGVIYKTIFSQAPERREVFIKKTKEKITRAEARKHLVQFYLSCELLRVIHRFFPGLLSY